jgi:hypothetical protein
VAHPFRAKFKQAAFKELKGAKVAWWIDAAMAVADMVGTGYEKSTEWAAKSGVESDYWAGAKYGVETAFWRNLFGAPFALLGGSLGAGLGALLPIPGGSFVGGLAGGFLGWSFGEGIADTFFEQGIRRKYLVESEVGRTALTRRKVNFGGNFRDSREAYTMRQQAVQEMAGSLLNARQYLGNEAAFMHA